MAEDKLTRWQRLRPYLERWAPLLTAFWAGMITLALLIAFLPWFRDTPHVAGSWLTPWTWPHMEALAAWIQAIGSIAAIYFAGRSAERLFVKERQLAREHRRNRFLSQSVKLDEALTALHIRYSIGSASLQIGPLNHDELLRLFILPAHAQKAIQEATEQGEIYESPLTDLLIDIHKKMQSVTKYADTFCRSGKTYLECKQAISRFATFPIDEISEARNHLKWFLPKS